MRYLFIIMRYLVLESYKCRLIMLCLIFVLIKSLRDLSSEGLDEYMLIQYAFVI